MPVLHRPSGLNVVSCDLLFDTPGQEMSRGEPRAAVVHAQRFRRAPLRDDAVEDPRDPVEGASSLFLMKRFYSQIAAGDSPELALTKAKREMLKSSGNRAVPYLWAGFTFEGVSGSGLHS